LNAPLAEEEDMEQSELDSAPAGSDGSHEVSNSQMFDNQDQVGPDQSAQQDAQNQLPNLAEPDQ